MAFEKISLNQWILSNPCTVDNYNDIMMPARSTKNAAGYDFFMPYDIKLEPGEVYKIFTGIKADLSKICPIETDDGGVRYLDIPAYLALYPRSSMGMKYGFQLLNTTGIIDSDYYDNESNEGHIIVACKVAKPVTLSKGDRFVQGIITPYYVMENDEDVTKVKRIGGMGSTGE